MYHLTITAMCKSNPPWRSLRWGLKQPACRLRYRVSVKGLAATPERFSWDARLFTPTLNYLPGLPRTHEPFASVTYPRFGSMGVDMFCSFRDGKAGLGNDHLYLYRPETGRFSYVGKHLTGVNSNPYVHGIDYRNGRLHITWVYRGFVHYDGWDDPLDTKHKQQAGPNGAANNHNICYAFSDDKGYTWKNAKGSAVASLKHGETITNDSDGVVAFAIPRGSGLSNQESQAVDHLDGVHILNRGYDAQGQYVWKHYYRPSEGKVTHETSQAPPPIDFHGRAENMQGGWEDRRLDSIVGNQRGQLAITSDGRLYIVLPKATTSTISILSATRARSYKDYVRVWEGTGLHGEPLIDTYRLQEDGVLSLFIRQSGGEPGSSMRVVVADFNLALV